MRRVEGCLGARRGPPGRPARRRAVPSRAGIAFGVRAPGERRAHIAYVLAAPGRRVRVVAQFRNVHQGFGTTVFLRVPARAPCRPRSCSRRSRDRMNRQRPAFMAEDASRGRETGRSGCRHHGAIAWPLAHARCAPSRLSGLALLCVMSLLALLYDGASRTGMSPPPLSVFHDGCASIATARSRHHFGVRTRCSAPLFTACCSSRASFRGPGMRHSIARVRS